MKIKKILIKTVFLISTLSAISAAALSTEALDLSVSNIYSYYYTDSGSYGSLYCYPESTGVSTGNENYKYSSKTARYKNYGDSNGSEYLISSKSAVDTTPSVFTDNATLTNYVVRREHSGVIRTAANSDSSVKESYYVSITKN